MYTTKNILFDLIYFITGLERVAEELMGRRKWKLYQDALIPKQLEGEQSSGDESMPATDHPPALKIKTIEQINESEEADEPARKVCSFLNLTFNMMSMTIRMD